jgi:hypothetical protein
MRTLGSDWCPPRRKAPGERSSLRSSGCPCPSCSSKDRTLRPFRETPPPHPDTFRGRADDTSKDICPRCISYSVLVPAPILYQRTVHFIFATRYHCSTRMNRASQHGRISRDDLAPCLPVHFSGAANLPYVNHGSQVTSLALLIATRMCVSTASWLRLPEGCHFSAPASDPFPEAAEINRDIQLIEPPVSHSKQKTAFQINRNISKGSLARFHSFPTPDTLNPTSCPSKPLHPTSQSAKISRTKVQS